MSEEVSYRTVAIRNDVNESLRKRLAERGIFTRNGEKWTSARTRADELVKRFNETLEQQRNMQSVQGMPAGADPTVEAMLSAFSSIPEFDTFAKASKDREYGEIVASVRSIRQENETMAGSEADKKIAALRERMSCLASDVQHELCNLEQSVMLEHMIRTLKNDGCCVDVVEGSKIKALKGPTCLWASVNENGDISMDLSGYSGIECMKEMSRIENAFRKEGIVFERVSSRFHGSQDGGSITRKTRGLFENEIPADVKREKRRPRKSKNRNKVLIA